MVHFDTKRTKKNSEKVQTKAEQNLIVRDYCIQYEICDFPRELHQALSTSMFNSYEKG